MQISIRESHVYVLGGKTAIPMRPEWSQFIGHDSNAICFLVKIYLKQV